MILNPELKLQRCSGIHFKLKFLTTLNFFGHGSYQKPTGCNYIFAQSQSSVSRSVKVVSSVLVKLANKYIKFPIEVSEKINNKIRFLEKFGMAGIICAIDGCHVALHQPSATENGYLYFNRKGFYSINMLAACNADQHIIFADANYPGSVHDSAIWQTSSLRRHVQQYSYGANNFILADSGFPIEQSLLTPVLGATIEEKEKKYNKLHKTTRNVIERTFGVLKMRFRCLCHHRTLHYKPKTVGKFIYCSIILHNICMDKNIPIYNDEELDEIVVDDSTIAEISNTPLSTGRRVRAEYINNYF